MYGAAGGCSRERGGEVWGQQGEMRDGGRDDDAKEEFILLYLFHVYHICL